MRRAARNGTAPQRLATALYLFLVGTSLVLLLRQTHGHFSYCLDDPYIHLALAERLRHGLYGLNWGEPASPSSSIVWPLLFVPFAGTAFMAWLPLLLNVAFGATTAWLLGSFTADSFSPASETDRTNWRAVALSLLLVVALNLVGLTFTGLEHSLQVLLCTVCALAAVRAMNGQRVSRWAIAAAILLPSVRYEGLLITIALAVTLCGVRLWRSAFSMLAASLVLPVSFSLFLHRLGLPWFPLSVLVKSSYKFVDRSPLLHRIWHLLVYTTKQSFSDPERLPQLILSVLLAALAWRHRRTRSLRFALLTASLVGIVQVELGPIGWFYRYEIYALAFTVPIFIAALALPGTRHMTESAMGTRSHSDLDVTSPALRAAALQRAPAVPLLLLVGVAAIAWIYMRPLTGIPRAALGIYEQQYQLGRLTRDLYHAPVGVNDLGWVAFGRTPQQYTLDLFGLGSLEAFNTKSNNRTPEWLDRITREHHVGLVAIFPEWFPQGPPHSWTAVAKLCARDVVTTLGPPSQRVMLYRTPEADISTVEGAIRQWRAELPANVVLQSYPPNATNSCE